MNRSARGGWNGSWKRIPLMVSRVSRYLLARLGGVWHLILHSLTTLRPAPGAAELAGGPDGEAARGADGGPMKITPWYLAALAPFAAIGCSGAYLGHVAVVGLTLGIFLGTLSLGRTANPNEPPRIG